MVQLQILIITLLIFPVNAFAGKYDEATDAAKKAAIKQSGFEFYIDGVKKYGDTELNRYLKELGLAPIAGPIGFIAKSLYYKKLTLRYKHVGLEVSEGKTQITYGWKF